jgi:2'-5' RNA ligase
MENDLFPDSLKPQAFGLDDQRGAMAMFFAIYPSAKDLQRIVEWQRRICRRLAPMRISQRPSQLLHITVAECGKPKQQREPLEAILRTAAQRFFSPSFEVKLTTIERFGAEDALVAIVDAEGARRVHELRIALADVQKHFGLSGERGITRPHLTLGYSDRLPTEYPAVEPISFRAQAVDFITSVYGESTHIQRARWLLT